MVSNVSLHAYRRYTVKLHEGREIYKKPDAT